LFFYFFIVILFSVCYPDFFVVVIFVSLSL